MDKRFKKLLGVLLLIALGITLSVVFASPSEGSSYISSSGLVNEHPGIVRFHVVANSDSEEDQALKLKVRDYVLERVQGAIAEEIIKDGQAAAMKDADLAMANSNLIRNYISDNLNTIDAWAEDAIKLYGYDYKATASLGIRNIPAKYYDDIFFPQGNYEALTISIGEGRGQNWWCVVFPPLCLIEEKQARDDGELANQQLVLKSKTAELLKGNKKSTKKYTKHIL